MITGMALSGNSGVPGPVSTQAPVLRGAVMMNQDWRDLTFLHWATDPRLQRFMPPGFVQTPSRVTATWG